MASSMAPAAWGSDPGSCEITPEISPALEEGEEEADVLRALRQRADSDPELSRRADSVDRCDNLAAALDGGEGTAMTSLPLAASAKSGVGVGGGGAAARPENAERHIVWLRLI